MTDSAEVGRWGRSGRAETGDAFPLEIVGDACDQRRLGADDDEVDVAAPAKRKNLTVIAKIHGVGLGHQRAPGISGRNQEPADLGRPGAGPRQRVLTAARAQYQHVHQIFQSRVAAPRASDDSLGTDQAAARPPCVHSPLHSIVARRH